MTIKELVDKLEKDDKRVMATELEYDGEEIRILSAIVMEYGERLTLSSEVWVDVKNYYKLQRPRLLQLAKDFSSSVLELTGAVLGGKNAIVSKSEFKRRTEICALCPAYNGQKNQCNVCRCFIEVKGALSSSKCPKGKWNKKQ